MAVYTLFGTRVESSNRDPREFAAMLRGADRNERVLGMDHCVLAQALRNSEFAWDLSFTSIRDDSSSNSRLNAAQSQRNALLSAVRGLSLPAQMRILQVWQLTTLPPWLRRSAARFASVAFVPSAGTVHVTRRGRMAPHSGVAVVVVHPRIERFGMRSRVCIDYKSYGIDIDPETGIVMIGGAERNKCAFRLSAPARAKRQGPVLGCGDTSAMWLGLSLHWNCIQAALGKSVRRTKLPRFWLTFAPQLELAPEVTASLEAEACHVLSLASNATLPTPGRHVLPSLRSPGGIIRAIHRGEDRTVVEVDSQLIELPACAVLKPWSIVGNDVPVGVALADFVPKGNFATWRSIVDVVGDQVGRRILEDVWVGMSFSTHGVNYVPLDFFSPYSAQRPIWRSLQTLLRLPDFGELRGPLPRGRRAVAPPLANSFTLNVENDVQRLCTLSAQVAWQTCIRCVTTGSTRSSRVSPEAREILSPRVPFFGTLSSGLGGSISRAA